MSMRTSLAALAIAGLSLAGGATAAAGVLAAAAPPAAAVLTATVAPPAASTVAPPAATVAPPAVLTTFGNPHQPAAVTLADITGDGSQSQGIPIPH
jgi:hypothetical protein